MEKWNFIHISFSFGFITAQNSWEKYGLFSPGDAGAGDGQLADEVLGLVAGAGGQLRPHHHRVEAAAPDGGCGHLRAEREHQGVGSAERNEETDLKLSSAVVPLVMAPRLHIKSTSGSGKTPSTLQERWTRVLTCRYWRKGPRPGTGDLV